MVWQCLHQPVIKNLFRLGEWLLDVERPWSGTFSFKETMLPQVEQEGDCGDEKNDDYEECLQDAGDSEGSCLRGLTFELSGRRRYDAQAARCKNDHCGARPGWHAVGSPLERGVRPHSLGC